MGADSGRRKFNWYFLVNTIAALILSALTTVLIAISQYKESWKVAGLFAIAASAAASVFNSIEAMLGHRKAWIVLNQGKYKLVGLEAKIAFLKALKGDKLLEEDLAPLLSEYQSVLEEMG